MKNFFDLRGKVILITGGYGYLGQAVCRGLLAHESTVIVAGRRSAEFDKVFAKEIHERRSISFVEVDIAKSDSIDAAFEKVASQFGGIHALINNAFYLQGQSPTEMDDESWKTGIDGTLNSVYRTIRAAIPHLRKTRGKIVNVSSMYGLVCPDFSVYDNYPEFLNPPHYGAAKAGVLQLTRYFAGYLGKEGICVNAVTPGPFPSETVQEKEGFIQLLREKTMLGRIGHPDDLIGAFVFLSSAASDFITGQNIIVDGGWTAR